MRFAEVVASSGAPEVITLWVDPKDDKSFQKSLREERIMTVHQMVIGSKKDFGEVGFVRAPNAAYLLFPTSLKQYAGRRIVGIDYARLSQPKLTGPAARPTRVAPPEKKRAHSGKEKKETRLAIFSSEKAGHTTRTTPVKPRVPVKLSVVPREPREKPPEAEAEPPVDPFMVAAIKEARRSLKQKGIPIGAALVRNGKLLAVGHNKRVQKDDPVAHAETDCLRNAGRLGSFRGCTLYSTLMPCFFCAGAAVQFGISKIVVGEKRNFAGAETFLRQQGIEVIDLDLAECREMLARFIRDHPKLWNEDIGR